jgi:hypothetical protein
VKFVARELGPIVFKLVFDDAALPLVFSGELKFRGFGAEG